MQSHPLACRLDLLCIESRSIEKGKIGAARNHRDWRGDLHSGLLPRLDHSLAGFRETDHMIGVFQELRFLRFEEAVEQSMAEASLNIKPLDFLGRIGPEITHVENELCFS